MSTKLKTCTDCAHFWVAESECRAFISIVTGEGMSIPAATARGEGTLPSGICRPSVLDDQWDSEYDFLDPNKPRGGDLDTCGLAAEMRKEATK